MSPILTLCAVYITWSVNLTQTHLAVPVFFFNNETCLPLDGTSLGSHCQISHSLSFLILATLRSLRLGLCRREASLKALITDL